MIIRAILPDWALKENPEYRKVQEGKFNKAKIEDLSFKMYNIYYLPNEPSIYESGTTVDGSQIDTFTWVFVDMDLKEGKYESKTSFIEFIQGQGIPPTKIVDSGNGVHVYWKVEDLDAMTYLRLQRRLARKYITDEAVCSIYQLMRLPGTINTKDPNELKFCELLLNENHKYNSEQLDNLLPPITFEDEEYCTNHFSRTYELDDKDIRIDDKLPAKFGALLKKNQEVKDLWVNNTDDRSKADFRLAHLMYGNGFTRDEALSVIVNCAKALNRAPKHRTNYALNIVDKIWTFEDEEEKKEVYTLSSSVKDILHRKGDLLKGTRFRCYDYLDNTSHGFRLGQVIGLVAGSGVGKTAVALNMFMGFVENNPDYYHFFVPLEQPANEIADRWKTMCGDRTELYEKVHVIDNYDNEGGFRNLSLDDIETYIHLFQRGEDKKVGCVVIDHIGALKKKNHKGENQDLMDICHSMKSFAVKTNTLVIMQSQSSREKAGIGDIELNKDAAYGTMYFEAYCDYLITMWQPLKRCYNNPKCPTVTAFKFCKIRHKKKGVDVLQEDTRYVLIFDPKTEHLRELTQDEEKSFTFFNTTSTNLRKQDRKTDLLVYTNIKTTKEKDNNVQT